MILINFGHPLTPEHQEQIEALIRQPITQLDTIPVQFDADSPFAEQCRALVDEIDLSTEAWQTQPILVNPPTLNVIAVTLLAELHGRMGYFPPILRLRIRPDSLPPEYELAEIIDLQAVREQARKTR